MLQCSALGSANSALTASASWRLHLALCLPPCAAGFAVAAFAGYGFIRGDVMQVAQDIENQIIPVTVTLQSRIGRLEKRIEELEAAKK